jgi:hypothetical protein
VSGGGGGTGRRGGMAGQDNPAQGSGDWWKVLRAKDPGGAFVASSTRFHFAGLDSHENQGHATHVPWGLTSLSQGYNAAGYGASNDWMWAIPEWFPVAGTIRRLAWLCDVSLQTAARLQLHLYRNTTVGSAVAAYEGWPYPGELLASSDEYVNPSGASGTLLRAGVRIQHSEVSLHVDARTLLWFVLRANAPFCIGGSGSGIHTNAVAPWMGWTFGPTSTGVDQGSNGCGWYHLHTYASGAAGVATFPQTAPLVIKCGVQSYTGVPGIAYGFAAD